MIGCAVPVRPAGVFAGGTPARRVVSVGVLLPHYFHMPAHEVRSQEHARALRAAFINLSLYTENDLNSGTVGNALFCLGFMRPSCSLHGGPGRSLACGAVASYVIWPLISGALPLIAWWQRRALAATGLEGYKSAIFEEVR